MTSGSLVTGKSSFGRGPLTCGFGLWTPPSPPLGPPEAGQEFMTPSPFSARTLAPPRWGLPLAREKINARLGGGDALGVVLTKQYADVSKLMYHMRINGDLLDDDLLGSFDGQLLASVSSSLVETERVFSVVTLAFALPSHGPWRGPSCFCFLN